MTSSKSTVSTNISGSGDSAILEKLVNVGVVFFILCCVLLYVVSLFFIFILFYYNICYLR